MFVDPNAVIESFNDFWRGIAAEAGACLIDEAATVAGLAVSRPHLARAWFDFHHLAEPVYRLLLSPLLSSLTAC